VIAGVHVAEIAASAREVFERETPRDAILTRLRSEPLSRGAWRAAAEVGWFRLLTSESAGGLEAGPAQLAALFREVGRYLPAGPFQETVVAGGLLRSLFDLGADDRVIGFGRSDLVEFADACDLILLSIDLGGPAAVVAVDPRQDGVSVTRLRTFDLVSSPCVVEVGSAQRQLLLEGAQATELLARIEVYDAIAAMATLGGLSAEVLDRSVRYAKDRVQFDRPIGSFQAVQHRLADMAVTAAAIESSLSAAVALADGPEIDAVAVRALRAEAAKLARGLAESGLQVHGGIGFTAEHSLHVYLKRTLRLEALAEAAGDPVAALGSKLLAAVL
jgi:alkylation response protein AidB-like acyl-CoA dehydrogenase